MKNVSIVGVLVGVALLSACSCSTPVAVVKGKDRDTISSQPARQVEMPVNMPSNVTAVCRDGSYSMSVENACSGRGGISTKVRYYHSE